MKIRCRKCNTQWRREFILLRCYLFDWKGLIRFPYISYGYQFSQLIWIILSIATTYTGFIYCLVELINWNPKRLLPKTKINPMGLFWPQATFIFTVHAFQMNFELLRYFSAKNTFFRKNQWYRNILNHSKLYMRIVCRSPMYLLKLYKIKFMLINDRILINLILISHTFSIFVYRSMKRRNVCV